MKYKAIPSEETTCCTPAYAPGRVSSLPLEDRASSDPGDRMRLRRWQVEIAVTLIVAAIVVYALRWFLFPAENFHREMLRYLVDDVAFLFIQVLLVSMLLDGLMQRRNRETMLDKLNMIIGAFFSECGTDVLGRIAKLDADLDEVRERPAGAHGVEGQGLRARQAGVPRAQAGHRAQHRRPRGAARAPRPGEDVPAEPARQPGAAGARGVHRPPLGRDAPRRGTARARRLRPPAGRPTARTSWWT